MSYSPPSGPLGYLRAPADRMARIAYIMHLDWCAIRQRPQALAEGLAQRGHEVTVMHPVQARARFTAPAVTPDGPGLTLRPLALLPLGRFAGLRDAGRAATRVALARWLRANQPDALWVTSAGLVPALPSSAWDFPVVSDVMDPIALHWDPGERLLAAAWERALVHRSGAVIASSAELAARLAPDAPHVELVRNACDDRWAAGPTAPVGAQRDAAASRRAPRLLFVGTISQLVDLPALLGALTADPGLEVHLAGPIAVRLPNHPRLRRLGVVRHDLLPDLAQQYDGLLMPFRPGPHVAAVDPVKLYEYVSWRRPVISLWYPEVARFADLVSFYSTRAEFLDGVADLIAGRLPAGGDPSQFLTDNSWSVRVAQVDRVLSQRLGLRAG